MGPEEKQIEEGETVASVRSEVLKLMQEYNLEDVPCLCGGNSFKDLYSKDRYGLPVSVVMCKRCNLIQINPRLPEEFYKTFYRKYYRKLHKIKERIGGLDEYFDWQYQRAKAIWPDSSSTNRSMRILEIGCSAGGMLQYFKDSGHQVQGIDLDEEYVEYGRKRGLDISVGTLDNISNKPEYVVLSHVIEHLHDPIGTLLKIKEIMHPRGWLYIECPGPESLYKYDMDFKKTVQLAHLYYFSVKTIENLLRRCGFGIEQVTAEIMLVSKIQYNIDNRFFHNGKAAAILSEPMNQKTQRMIAGHPRSGTMYMSTFLQALGIDMKHQELGKDGVVSWQHIANNEYRVECDNVIHQVRHPLKVIASTAYTFDSSGYPFMFDCVGEPTNKHPLAIAMYTWIKWNELIEQRAKGRFQIENFGIDDLLDMLGLKIDITDMPQIQKNVNAIPHIPTSWEELEAVDKGLCNEVKEMAARYGYSQ